MSYQTTRVIGAWTPCSKCNTVFFRYEFGHKCYSIGDKIGICSICLWEIKIQNGTLPKKNGDISQFVHHKNNDARPESDSL